MKTNWGFSTDCKLNIMQCKLNRMQCKLNIMQCKSNVMQCKLNMSCKFEELKLSVRVKWNEGSTYQ